MSHDEYVTALIAERFTPPPPPRPVDPDPEWLTTKRRRDLEQATRNSP